VFEAERPARSEGVFDADTNRRAPAGFACTIEAGVHQKRTNRGVFVVGNRSTALHVEQGAVPGIADLAGEQAERVNLALVLIANKSWVSGQADVAAAEIGPVALRFQTEHHRRHLPAIADLSTEGAAGCMMAAFLAEAIRTPVKAAGSTPAVDTDVETAPVIGGLHNRWRLRVGRRARGKIRSDRRCSDANRDRCRRENGEFVHF